MLRLLVCGLVFLFLLFVGVGCRVLVGLLVFLRGLFFIFDRFMITRFFLVFSIVSGGLLFGSYMWLCCCRGMSLDMRASADCLMSFRLWLHRLFSVIIIAWGVGLSILVRVDTSSRYCRGVSVVFHVVSM